ncbi:hypothetical protein L6452_10929 [Arctium lappa]|uniref:Uncharacterized protein n=1 Tax=Arctium lappa TaxID=4217 RepID=A0ACB9DNT9_ARCLA|nr:hypothetical protein L6452_10929 [Arctium lappa]
MMMDFKEERWVSRHTHVKMSWLKYEIHKRHVEFQQSHLYSSSFSPPFTVTIHKASNFSPSSSTSTKINPAVLFIIIILALLFFISGLLHLLVRFLAKHHSSSNTSQSNTYPDSSTSNALQRQLQQLFHLHDSGLDQAFIDTLPVFMYTQVVGTNYKQSFDCAVCLSEFNEMDKLRLLPTCSHAFHINCIDTWLLSNSTCPLCRNTLFNHGVSMDNPVFEFDEMREADGIVAGSKIVEHEQMVAEKGVFLVRLGKFRKLIEGEVEIGGGESSSSNLDARRCYSMGSYEYVVGDTSLKVALNRKRDHQDANGNLTVSDDTEGKKITIGAKTDSYSVSKIWLWSKRGKFASSSENQVHNPSSVDMELPWMGRMQGRI